jgi:hypothetical protein
MSKTAVASAALAIALGSAATALAGPGGHGGPGGGMGFSGGGIGTGAGAMNMAHGPVGGSGPGAMSAPLGPGAGHATTFNRAGPMTNGPVFNHAPVNGPIGRTGGNWTNNNWHHGDHHHHHHGNAFVAFGFGGGPYYDYASNSCWAQVPTYYGWQWVYVCGDYGYY